MFVVSWQTGAGAKSAGYATEREAERRAAHLVKKSEAKHAVVWELDDDGAA